MRKPRWVLATAVALCIGGVSVSGVSFASDSMMLNASHTSTTTRWGGSLGIGTYDGQTYLTVSLQPDLSVGRFGVGLDLPIRINEDGIRKEDWQLNRDLVGRTVRYVRWGLKGDPLYIKAGALQGETMGSGALIDGYSNTSASDLRSGLRRPGLILDARLNRFGVESLVGDLSRSGLVAARVYAHPFPEDFPVVRELSVGATLARDSRSEDPFNRLHGTALDAVLPVLNPLLTVYGYHASLVSHGTGQALGLKGHLWQLLSYRLEARRHDSDFIPGVFNGVYENAGVNWHEYPAGGKPVFGLLFAGGLHLLQDSVVIGARAERNFNSDPFPRLTGELRLGGPLLRHMVGRDVGVEASYSQALVAPSQAQAGGNGSDARLTASARVGILPGTQVVYAYEAVRSHAGWQADQMRVYVSFGTF